MKRMIERKIQESKNILLKLQAQRTKANKSRKVYYQRKIEEHFGLK